MGMFHEWSTNIYLPGEAGFNRNDKHTCPANWSTWDRKNVYDLPDILIPEDQFEKIKQKHITAKDIKNKYKNPTQKI